MTFGYCLNLYFFDSYWCEMGFWCLSVSLQFFYCEWHFQALCPLLCWGIHLFFWSWRTCFNIKDIFIFSGCIWLCTICPSVLFIMVFAIGKFLLFLSVIKFVSLFLYVFCLYVMLSKSFPATNSKTIHIKCFQVALWFLFYIKLQKPPRINFGVWCAVGILCIFLNGYQIS